VEDQQAARVVEDRVSIVEDQAARVVAAQGPTAEVRLAVEA
jgi:hypothetical protein